MYMLAATHHRAAGALVTKVVFELLDCLFAAAQLHALVLLTPGAHASVVLLTPAAL